MVGIGRTVAIGRAATFDGPHRRDNDCSPTVEEMTMRILVLAVGLFLTSRAVADVPGYKLDPGPFKVQTVEKLTLHDRERKKELIVRVYYPKGDGPFPVVVFSHGFGAGIEAYSSVSQHWASHGYITIHPQHSDARKTDDNVERPKLGVGGLRNLTSGLGDRVKDVTAVIDALDELTKKVPDLKDKLDKGRIGVSGHSYGACVSMLIGGVTVEANGKVQSYADSRVTCILPFSAAGTGEYGLTKESWKKAEVPVLYVTGTKDIRPGHDAAWRNEPFDLSPPKDKHLLVIEGANHFSYGGGPARGGLLGRGGDSYGPLVKASSLAFLDAYLKDVPEAKAFLKADGGMVKFAGTKAKFSVK
jgi:predicted dienelactone hydrolase